MTHTPEMSLPFIDTDILIRYLTGDDPKKQAQCAALLSRVERGTLAVAAPLTVFADCIFVLSSPRLYNLPRAEVAALLMPLVRLRRLVIRNRYALIRALGLYASTSLDFGDGMIVASMQLSGATVIYSYDKDFDRVRGITRKEPS